MFWLGDKGRGTNTKGMGLMDYRIGGGYWRIWAQSRTFWLVSPSSGTVLWDSHQCLYSVLQRVLFCHPWAVCLVPKGPRRKYYYWNGGNTAEQATTLGSRVLEEGSYFIPSDGCVSTGIEKMTSLMERSWRKWNSVKLQSRGRMKVLE